MSDLTDTAVATGFASFMATFGRVPENFELLAQHAPEAFAGYGLMRSSVMRDRQDTLAGQTQGAKNHAAAAIRLGLTLPELSEGLVQVIMVGGITTWNATGAEVLRHCSEMTSPAVDEASAGGSPA